MYAKPLDGLTSVLHKWFSGTPTEIDTDDGKVTASFKGAGTGADGKAYLVFEVDGEEITLVCDELY